jgi:hypothetical protein
MSKLELAYIQLLTDMRHLAIAHKKKGQGRKSLELLEEVMQGNYVKALQLLDKLVEASGEIFGEENSATNMRREQLRKV